MVNNRRRTYLLSLLSMGEVLYCGVSSDDYIDEITVTLSRSVNLSKELVMVGVMTTAGSNNYDEKTAFGLLFDLNRRVHNNSFDFKLASNNTVTVYDTDYSSRGQISVVVAAIPRTDV